MTLDEIAEHMSQSVQVSNSGTAQWIMARGLRLQLTETDGRRYLRISRCRISREHGAPSDAEIAACRVAFKVPDDADCGSGVGAGSRPYTILGWAL